MDKETKTNIKETGSKWYVICVYIIIPILIATVSYSIHNLIVEIVSKPDIAGIAFENSEHTKREIIEPFISSALLIISLLVAILLIKGINCLIDKDDEKFDLEFAKKVIFWTTIVTAILSTVALFYLRANSFEYWKYGVEKLETSSGYLHLMPVPSVRGGNITSENASIVYRCIHYFGNLLKQIEDKFELIISMASTIVIPLTIKVEKSTVRE